MKKPFLRELQDRLLGSVTDEAAALDYFSTDGSIFTMRPVGVVYPQTAADVRRTVGFAAERTRAGKLLSVVARGRGTDLSGGAIGDGLQIVFPAHMNRLVHLGRDTVTVQPGMNYKTLQQILEAHGRYLPPYPASLDYSTIGGAVANNAAGERSLKYGSTRRYVTALKVVLADGSIIQTKRLSAKELSRKKGQSDLEGAIYRKVDSLILDNGRLIRAHQPSTTKNAAGYSLTDVGHRDGTFDLTPLLVGSQGTLGVITEITLKTAPLPEATTVIAAYFDDVEKAGEAVVRLRELNPSALEMVDGYLLEYLHQHQPGELSGLVPQPWPKIVLLVELDDASRLQQTMKARRILRLLSKTATGTRVATDPLDQAALWKVRWASVAAIWLAGGTKKALPVVEDGIVPPDKLAQFLTLTYRLLEKHGLTAAVWGHAGDGHLHMQPLLNLGKPKDTDKILTLAGEYYDLVISLGGSTTGEHNDGLLRGPYLKNLYGEELCRVMSEVKSVFDPDNVLNPGKKLQATSDDIRGKIRHEYTLRHLYDQLPYN